MVIMLSTMCFGHLSGIIQVPQGYVLTVPNAGNDDVDSDFASATLSGITLASSQPFPIMTQVFSK